MGNGMKLKRIEAGRYVSANGRYTVIGLFLRWDGRDGSRINAWLVKDAFGPQRQYSTLADVREALGTTVAA